jgi:hypothetical protein
LEYIIKKTKKIKKNVINNKVLNLNKKQKEKIASSVDKKNIKKNKDIISKQLFSNRLNFKKINSLKLTRKKENISFNIFNIKKLNNHNKSSSVNLNPKKISSLSKKSIHHNNKFFNRNINDNVLINSFIKYKNIQSKIANKNKYN